MSANNWTQKLNKWFIGFVMFALFCFLWAGLHKKPLIGEANARVQQFPYFDLAEVRKENKKVTLNDVTGEIIPERTKNVPIKLRINVPIASK